MKKTKDELLKAFGEIIGERNDETVIGFMEDISDSVVENPEPTDEYKNHFEEMTTKYDELLKRFKARFYDEEREEEKREEIKEDEEREITYNDIFKEGE